MCQMFLITVPYFFSTFLTSEIYRGTQVLNRAGGFLGSIQQLVKPEDDNGVELTDMNSSLLSDTDVEAQRTRGQDAAVQSISGVILTSSTENFMRSLFRSQRGLVVTNFTQIEEGINDPYTGSKVYKSCFTSFFHGDQASLRIMKIATSFGANIYDIPSSATVRADKMRELIAGIKDIETVQLQTFQSKVQELRAFYQQVQPIQAYVKSESVVYHTLNYFKPTPSGSVMYADCWIPAFATQIIQDALDLGAAIHNSPPVDD